MTEGKVNITRGVFRIGRDSKCEIFINNPSVSKVHAVIEAESDGITVHDERSSNGTRKGGMRLKPDSRYNLTDGEELLIGNVVARFSLLDRMDDDASSNASETLLDDHEEDAENVPPNFVPETPQVVKKPRMRENPSLPDLTFQPESQSSPLPTSATAILKTSQFQVPESPSSDFNDSSYIAASQQTNPGKLLGRSAVNFRPGCSEWFYCSDSFHLFPLKFIRIKFPQEDSESQTPERKI